MPVDPISLVIEGTIAAVAIVSLGATLSISQSSARAQQRQLEEEEKTNELLEDQLKDKSDPKTAGSN